MAGYALSVYLSPCELLSYGSGEVMPYPITTTICIVFNQGEAPATAG
jgi:hypothetical protein